MYCTTYTYYITLMAKFSVCLIASSVKIINRRVLIQVSQYGFMLRLICMFLGCDLPIQLLLKCISSEYHDRLENCFIMYQFTPQTTSYVTFYA